LVSFLSVFPFFLVNGIAPAAGFASTVIGIRSWSNWDQGLFFACLMAVESCLLPVPAPGSNKLEFGKRIISG